MGIFLQIKPLFYDQSLFFRYYHSCLIFFIQVQYSWYKKQSQKGRLVELT